MELAKKHKLRLKDIQEKIRQWHDYFDSNVKTFNQFKKFVFDTSISDDDSKKLQELGKPILEFNILEALISRLEGEFEAQEPAFMVRAADGMPLHHLTPEYLKSMEVLEAHFKSIFNSATNDNFQLKIFDDLLGGGYSVAQIYTDYINEKSFEQNIYVERVFDPTLCGFDPMARLSHKGDGGYCFQLFPFTRPEFEAEFGKEVADTIKSVRSLEGFSWSYKNQKEDIILVADFYEKQYKKQKIHKLTNGRVVTDKEYKEIIEIWEDSGIMEVPPAIMQSRTSNMVTIVRYRLCQSQVLDFTQTNYRHLPLIFIDGKSVDVKNSNNGASQQKTRPYVYHAAGMQKLKNFAGQTIACEIENMVQHKFKVAVESIPDNDDYAQAYKNVQLADVLVFNAYDADDPNKSLPPPTEVNRTNMPPVVENAFQSADNTTQVILGSYEAALGMVSGNVSGKAIQQGAIQSSATAKPYLAGYINGLNRMATIICDLIPKYYVTPRSLPIVDAKGRKSYVVVNNPQDPDSLFLHYDPDTLNIEVEAGVNSTLQKQVALEQITRMMDASEVFADFVNTEGLEVILDNMDIRGIEQLKVAATKYQERLQQQQQEAANQPSPEQQIAEAEMLNAEAEMTKAQNLAEIETMKAHQRMAEAQGKQAIEHAKIAVDKQKADQEFVKILGDVQAKNRETTMKSADTDSIIARRSLENAMDVSKVLTESIKKDME